MKKLLLIPIILFCLPSVLAATSYYFNQSGSDANNCTISFPCKSITKANTISNGTVLFNGANIWIEPIDGWLVTKDNMTYGSYGNGQPEFWGGLNVSNTGNWTNKSNLWNSTFLSSLDVQMFYNGSIGKKSSTYGAVDEQGEFYYDSASDKITIYSTANPATYYSLVIVAQENDMISIEDSDNTTIQNIRLRYGAKHGISGADTSKITIVNNDIAYIGGAYLSGTTRYGNAIQFWDNSFHINVSQNNISYVLDAGISPQSATCGKDAINHTYSYNIITHTRYPVEIFMPITGCSGNQGILQHINVTNNDFLYFGDYFLRSSITVGIRLGTATDNTSDINFRDNIFSNSSNYIISLEGDGNHYNWNGDYPIFNYNVYYPNHARNFTRWENDYYSSVTAFNAGQGMEANGAEFNPLLSSNYYPMSSSQICTMGSTGSYVGALPCVADSAAPEIRYVDDTSYGTIYTDTIFTHLNADDTSEFYSFLDYDRSLQLWWRFEGDVLDNSTYGRNGLIGGSVVKNQTSCRYGNCLYFNASNVAYVNYTFLDNNFTGDYSYCLWYSSLFETHPNFQILAALTSKNKNGTKIQTNGDKFRFMYISEDSGTDYVISNIGDIDSNYHHICLVKNSTHLTAFWDGALAGSGSIVSYGPTDNDVISFSASAPASSYNGSIDEVMLFNRSLKIEEIRAIYNSSLYIYTANFSGSAGYTHSIKGYAVDKQGLMSSTENRDINVNCTIPVENTIFRTSTHICTGTYTLYDEDLNASLRIYGDDITLDGHGSVFIGNRSQNETTDSYGLYASSSDNVVIRNISFSNYSYGIYLMGVNVSNISYSNAYYNYYTNFVAKYSNSTTVEFGNFSYSNDSHGVYISNECHGYTIRNNTFERNFNHGVHINSNEVGMMAYDGMVYDNYFEGNLQDAISLYAPMRLKVFNNNIVNHNVGINIQNNRQPSCPNCVAGSTDVEIYNNTLIDGTYDYYLMTNGTNNISIHDNIHDSKSWMIIRDSINYPLTNINGIRINLLMNDTISNFTIRYLSTGFNASIAFNYTGRMDIELNNRTLKSNEFTAGYDSIHNGTKPIGHFGSPYTFQVNLNEVWLLGEDPFSPSVTLLSPSNGATESSPVTFSYSVTDANEVNCSFIADGIVYHIDYNVSIGTTNSFILTLPEPEDYTWYVSCVDFYGNTGVSLSRAVRISSDIEYAAADTTDALGNMILIFGVIAGVLVMFIFTRALMKGEIDYDEYSRIVFIVIITGIAFAVFFMVLEVL